MGSPVKLMVRLGKRQAISLTGAFFFCLKIGGSSREL